MTSAINANNIDGTYPVAGQDNDSQGFRDNFTNIKTNFEYAASEISDLQLKAVLKSPLTGTTLNNNMNGSILSNAEFKGISQTQIALGSVSGPVTLSFAAGPYYTLTTTGSVTIQFSNWAATGKLCTMRAEITIADINHTVTVPSAVGTGVSNSAARYVVGKTDSVIKFAAVGTYVLEFSTRDAGTSIFVEDVTRSAYYSGSEDVAAGNAVSLATSVSYFSTTTAETATLADGVAGQIKTLIMYSTGGNMVVTVTNAGWKSSGSGTITFDTIGDSCTLQYINNKWFCIGNNGATFA